MTSKQCFFITFSIIHLCVVTSISQSNSFKQELSTAESNLTQHPENHEFYQKLHKLVADKSNITTFSQRERLRLVFEQYGKWSSETTYPENEKGNKIQIQCHVKNEKGEPIAGAKIHIFQTDANGFYSVTDSATKRMGENDARLFAYLKSDVKGNIVLKTIRPASYPKKYNGRSIPQHIHFNISASGYKDKNIQMVFQDDPNMDTYWQKWARDADFPIVKLSYLKDKTVGNFEVLLLK